MSVKMFFYLQIFWEKRSLEDPHPARARETPPPQVCCVWQELQSEFQSQQAHEGWCCLTQVHLVKAALAVNFVFFSLQNLLTYKKTYKRVFGCLFRLERKRYCSTFTINIECSLIHSINISISALQANVSWYSVLAAFWRKCFFIQLSTSILIFSW